ncbi:MAG: hypothetical protein NTX87_02260 [Planctomycetota bacterium]|nr:hypothetical protein [Planctomycetota bacterium]
MKTLKWTLAALVTAVLASAAAAQTAPANSIEMASLAPADAKALIETLDATGLRQDLLKSKFWAALGQTQAFQEWRAGEKYAQMRQRIDQFLRSIDMSEDQALKTYLGRRSAVVLLPSGDEKKPDGVLLLQVAGAAPDESEALARRFVEAVGAQEVKKHRDVAVWEVLKDGRIDRMAFTGGVLMITSAGSDALERVLDAALGGPSLGATEDFKRATEGLPPDWGARAYAAQCPPRKGPGAVALYPQGSGHVHFEWRLVGGEADLSLTRPAQLAGPGALPDTAVAAVSSVFYPDAIWEKIKAKAAEQGAAGDDKIRRAEMFMRGWFTGKTMPEITSAFGPEASLAVLKGEADGAPGLVGLLRISPTGMAVARAFKDGLAAKAMILAALRDPNQQDGPRINVREETVGSTPMLVVEAPGLLDKVLGDWAKDIALTVAVTDQWLIIGTSASGVRASIRTATGAEAGATLAASLAAEGEMIPTGPVTHWGVIRPAGSADIVLGFAEKLAGKERLDQARKLTNLAELLKLVKRLSWQRTDEAEVICGKADIQAME